MGGTPIITVAVVSWNTRELLDRCLRSLADDPRIDSWVVDNASSDGSAELVRTRYPTARLVEAEGNLGFGRAVNLVASATSTPWLACANADVALEPGALDALLDAATRDPDAGALAPRLVLPDGSTQHSVYPFPSLRFTLGFQLGVLPGDRFLLEGAWDPERERRVPWAIAAFLLVRREAWEAAGGFDPEQWMYAEDLDLGWRLACAGWATRYVPGAHARHESAAATSQAWGEERTLRWQEATYEWIARRRGARRAGATAWLNVRGARARAKALGATVRVPLGDRAARAWRRERACGWARLHAMAVQAALDGQCTSDDPARSEPAGRTGPAGTHRGLVPIQVWTDRYPVLSESFVVTEVRELIGLGHPVEVLAGARPVEPAPAADGALARYLTDETTRTRARAMLALAARHPLGVLGDLRARRRWARDEHVVPLRYLAPAIRWLDASPPGTHVHVHFAAGAALAALRASRITRRRHSLTAHAYDIYLQPTNLAEKLRSAAFATSGCDYTVATLREIAGPGHDERIHRIVMGIDPERFRRGRPHAAGTTVVAIGRLVEKKGFLHLVRAAAQPALAGRVERVRIIGDGPQHDALAAEIAALGLGGIVELAGALAPEAVREALEDAAVLAMPCVVAPDGDRDSLPVVVKEALAMEVPVVASEAVGLPELVAPPFGRLVPPGDEAALAGALAELLALGVAERAELGRRGREHVAAHANARIETERLAALIRAG